MQDRVSLYPGRVKLEPVAGQANLYDLTRADQPTQEGTPLNKASLLKDATATAFGLGTDALPDDVLNLLSRFQAGLGNEYVWMKAHNTIDLGEGTTISDGYISNWAPNSQNYASSWGHIRYADTAEDVLSGNYTEVVSNQFGTQALFIAWINETLPNKFYLTNFDGGWENAYKYLFFFPSNSRATASDSYSIKVNSVIRYDNATIDFFTDGYVNSPNPSSYPPATSDGFIYSLMGKIGGFAKVTNGSYIGTGSAQIIPLSFIPQLVIVNNSITAFEAIGTKAIITGNNNVGTTFNYTIIGG